MHPLLALMHHTHWDREWYEPFATYQLRLCYVLEAVLDRLESGQLPAFTLDGQTSLLTDALALRPDLKPRLQNLTQNGQLSVGPWFTAPDEWLVCGEALKRNLQRGITEARQWGSTTFVGYLPDTFGHSADMPTLLHQAGMDTAIVWRGVPPHLSPVFWWQSPTQPEAKVLVYHLPQGYFQNILHDPDLTAEQRQEAFNQLVQQLIDAHKGLPVLLPLGGDHLGPTPHRDLIAGLPVVHPAEFMHRLKAALPDNLPTFQGELMDNTVAHVLPGVWSARLDLKIRNRRAEHRLLHHLEPVLDWLKRQGITHPTLEAGLAEAWRLLLLNHPHDSICGCSVDAVHRENHTRFDAIDALVDRLTVQALHMGLDGKGLTQGQTGPAQPQHLLSHWGEEAYTGLVPVCFKQLPDAPSIADSLGAAFQLDTAPTDTLLDSYVSDIWDVPLSHVTMRQTTGWLWVNALPPHQVTPLSTANLSPPPQPVTAFRDPTGNPVLDNGLIQFCLTADAHWCVQTPGGQVLTHLFELTAQTDAGDSYNSAPTGPIERAPFNQAEITLTGPLVARLALQVNLSHQPVNITVELKAGQPWLDITLSWFNTRPNSRIQAHFRQINPIGRVRAESHCQIITRRYPLPHTPPALSMPRGGEWLPRTGPIQRFVMTDEQFIVTDGLTEYEVQDNRLAITLHRGFSQISKGDNPTRNMPAGPPFKTPDAQLLNQTLTRRLGWAFPPPNDPTATRWAEQFYGVTQGQTIWLRG